MSYIAYCLGQLPISHASCQKGKQFGSSVFMSRSLGTENTKRDAGQQMPIHQRGGGCAEQAPRFWAFNDWGQHVLHRRDCEGQISHSLHAVDPTIFLGCWISRAPSAAHSPNFFMLRQQTILHHNIVCLCLGRNQLWPKTWFWEDRHWAVAFGNHCILWCRKRRIG